jgi:aminopeptidase N
MGKARKFLLLACLLLAACGQPASEPTGDAPDATGAPPETSSPGAVEVATATRPPAAGATPELAPAAAPGIGDPYYPGLGNGGYDALHYTIELEVDVANNHIEGATTLDAQATEELAAFNLDFLGHQIESVEVDGEAAEYARDGSELTIRPALPVPSEADFAVTVTYAGMPEPVDDPAVPFDIGWLSDGDTIYTVSEPSGSMNWYPVNNHPADKATYTFRITVPQPYVVAANGLLQEEIAGEGTTTYVWESADPIASYLTTVNIAEFEVTHEEGPDGLPLRTYLEPGLGEGMADRFAATSEMITFVSDILGPYPFEAFGAVVVDAPFPGALETQTLPVYASGLVRENVIVHELAHQWLGDSVTPATWQDIWLNEGFARYFEALWYEHTAGPEALEGFMTNLYRSISMPGIPPTADPGVGGLFSPATYDRGAWTLHALRLEVGDEAFFEILRTYYDRHKNGNASTADFIAVAEEVAGRDLTEFFDAWLYDTELPEQ